MKANDLLANSVRELMRRKRRSMACMAGYALATASLILFSGVWFNARHATDSILATTGTHFIAFLPDDAQNCATGNPGCCFPGGGDGFWFNGTPTRLLPTEFIGKVAKLPTVRDASACLLLRMTSPRTGTPYLLAGVDASNPTAVKTTSCAATDLVSGQFLQAGKAAGAMLEEAYAKSQGLSAGDKVEIAERKFNVVGIVSTGVRPAKADVYLTLEDARDVAYSRMFDPPADLYNLALVEARDSSSQEQAYQDVKALLADSCISGYNCYRPAAQVMQINRQTSKMLLLAIGLSTLLLALKSQWASMIERRRDIAILKTLGWSPLVIVAMLVLESLFQALLGGLAGCAAGQLLLAAGPAIGIGPTALSIGFSAIAWAIAIGLALWGGFVAGLLPALYAGREWPAVGLRSP